MKFSLGFLGVICLVQCILGAINLNAPIQQRITDVLEYVLPESQTWESHLVKEDVIQHALRLRQFRDFVDEFDRNYESDSELKVRFEAFKDNMDSKDHFEANEQGTAVYGMTEFMDYQPNELLRFGRVCKKEPRLSESESAQFQSMVAVGDEVLRNLPNTATPSSVDYRKNGLVSKVLNQGYCSSAWAYAAVTSLETANAIKTGHFERLSKQQLIDCDNFNAACCGGYPHYTYLYLNKVGGIELDKTYNGRPFVQRCHFNPSNAKVQVKGIVMFTNTSFAVNEKIMEEYVAEHGPVVVMLSFGAFKSYKSGILRQSDTSCSKNSNELYSSVALVGYGEENGVKFWIAKNSLGPKWGEKGFLRIERGTNMCALGTYGVAPVVG